jgi:hypothetical protein
VTESKFPPGWDADRVNRLLAHYDSMTEEQLLAEDEAAAEAHTGQVVVTVPDALLPAIRQLLAAHKPT